MRIAAARPRRPGAAAVEFAILLPLLMSLLWGLWEVGRMVNAKQIISNAAREGARAASTGFRDFADVEATIESYLQNSGITNITGVTVTVRNLTQSLGDTYDPSLARQNDVLEVSVSVPYDNLRWASTPQITPINTIASTVQWTCMKDLPIEVTLDGSDIPQVPVN